MDPYAPCPCGSGKKLKFCCQDIIVEMEKIERLQEHNQPRMALQLLEKLDKTHPHNPWIATHRGVALLDDHRPDEARAALLDFLRVHPEHSFASALYAIASFNAEGYPAAKKAVHRAFRRSVAEHPEMLATLAGSIAAWHLGEAHYLAARQHMALALRLGNDEQKRRTFLALVEIDGDPTIPYPLRGMHPLPDYTGPDSVREQVQKAVRLSGVGCWQEAADLLQQASDHDPDSAALWQAIGLLRAWDGDQQAAALALHRAARHAQDFDSGVECETIAQLLDQYAPGHCVRMRVRAFRVDAVARLLTQLDNAPQCARVVAAPDEADQPGHPAAVYHVVDRPLPAPEELSRLTSETLPRLLGRVTIFDRSEDGEDPAQAFVNALEGDPLEQSVRVFTDAAGELAAAQDPPEATSDDDVTGLVPRDQLAFHRNWYFPPRTPGTVRNAIQNQEWDELLVSVWPNAPQAALGGRTPLEAAGQPDLKAPLAAAVQVLDVFCGSRGYLPPLDDLRERLHLDPPSVLTVGGDDSLNTLSLMQLCRFNLAPLDDRQLQRVMQRAALVRHPDLLYKVLTHFVRSPSAEQDPPGQRQAFATLSDLCRDSLRRDEALDWLRRGRELTERHAGAFEDVLLWKMRELTLRLDDPEDPGLRELLLDLWNTYGSKLPPLRGQLTELIQALDIEPPWDAAILTPQSVGARADAGVWSPLGSEPVDAPGKKLWLPGDG